MTRRNPCWPMEIRLLCSCEGISWIVQLTMRELSKGMWLSVHWWNPTPYVQSNFIHPSKPAKYRLLFKSINAVRHPYIFVTARYVGKPQNEDGLFYHPATENVTKHLNESHGWQTVIRSAQHIFRPIVHIVYACSMDFEQKRCDLHWWTDGK